MPATSTIDPRGGRRTAEAAQSDPVRPRAGRTRGEFPRRPDPAPGPATERLFAEERRRLLVEALHRGGSLSVAEAERMLNVSRMTVHRDLDALAAQGLARKVHGGVVAAPEDDGAARWAKPFQERLAADLDAKRAIARRLLRLTAGARTLVLDASTTAWVFGQELARRPESGSLFVVTGSLPLFQELVRHREGPRAALHGGEPHPRTGSLVGPLAVAGLAEARFDWAVVSACGLMEGEGIAYDATPEEAEVKRAYLARARRKVLAVDTSKLNVSAPYLLAPLAGFDALATENGAFEPEKKYRD